MLPGTVLHWKPPDRWYFMAESKQFNLANEIWGCDKVNDKGREGLGRNQTPCQTIQTTNSAHLCCIQILRVFSNLNDSMIQSWIITENYLWAKEGSRKLFWGWALCRWASGSQRDAALWIPSQTGCNNIVSTATASEVKSLPQQGGINRVWEDPELCSDSEQEWKIKLLLQALKFFFRF